MKTAPSSIHSLEVTPPHAQSISVVKLLFCSNGAVRQHPRVPSAVLWVLPILHPEDICRMELGVLQTVEAVAKAAVCALRAAGRHHEAADAADAASQVLETLRDSANGAHGSADWGMAAEAMLKSGADCEGIILAALRLAAERGDVRAAYAFRCRGRHLIRGWLAAQPEKQIAAGWPAAGRTLETLAEQTFARALCAAKGAGR